MTDPNRWTLVVAADSVGAAATVVRSDGSQEVLEVEGRPRIESVVAVDEGGLLIAGPTGARRAAERPAWSLRDPLHRLEAPTPVVLGASRHAATEVAATIIRFFARLGAARIGRPAAAVRLACPEWWDDDVRHRLADAAAAAGFTSCEVVGAGEAAVAALRASGGPVSPTLVYDVQATEVVVSLFDADLRALGSPARLPTWGVDLVDEQLTDAVGARLDPGLWRSLEEASSPEWMEASSALRSAVGDARRVLSRTGAVATTEAEVAFDTPGGRIVERVRGFEVATITSELVAGTADHLRMLLGDRGVGLAPVVRVSGEPLAGVGEGLRAALPMATVLADFPELAALYGVALVGAPPVVVAAAPAVEEAMPRELVPVEPTESMPTAAALTVSMPVVPMPAGSMPAGTMPAVSMPAGPMPAGPMATQVVDLRGTPPGVTGPPGVAGPPEREGRQRAVLVTIATVLAALVLGAGAYALTGRGSDDPSGDLAREEISTPSSTTPSSTTPSSTTPSSTTPSSTTPSSTTPSSAPPSSATPTSAPPLPALSSVLLTDADVEGWSTDVFTFDAEATICDLEILATPVEFEGRAWSKPTETGSNVYAVSNWIERYADADAATAIYQRDAALPSECADTQVEIGGITFDASFQANTTDFEALGVGDVVVISGVLTNDGLGAEINVLSAAQRWGPYYTIVQLSSDVPFSDAVVEEYILLIQEAFARSTDLPR